MRPGPKPKTYLLAVKKGGRWLSPKMKVRCSYVDAVHRLKVYIRRSSAQEGTVSDISDKILLRLRPYVETVVTFELLEGAWP